MTHIFISYSRKDAAFAQRLANDLTARGHDVWLDVKQIPPGSTWDQEIERALAGSDVLLMIISPDSVASKNVGDEWGYFLDKNKLVIPIKYREAEAPLRLRRTQHIDLSGRNYDQGFQRLVDALAGSVPTASTVATAKPKSNRPIIIGAGAVLMLAVLVIVGLLLSRNNSAAQVTLIAAATTPTSTATSTSTATPTDAPTETPPAPTSTVAPSATAEIPPPTETPIEATLAPTLAISTSPITVYRSPDTLAFCAAKGTNLTALYIEIGTSESYALGAQLTDATMSILTQDGCLCLQQRNAVAGYAKCTGSNTFIARDADQTTWSKAFVKVTLDIEPLGICTAQLKKRDIYECPLN